MKYIQQHKLLQPAKLKKKNNKREYQNQVKKMFRCFQLGEYINSSEDPGFFIELSTWNLGSDLYEYRLIVEGQMQSHNYANVFNLYSE